MKPTFVVTKKDLKMSFFSGKGAGGQHRNKHQNCVRLSHPDSGVDVVAQNHKEKSRNIKDALRRLADHPKFRWFCEQKLRELEGRQSVEQWVEEQMKPENIQVFCERDGKFVDEKTGEILLDSPRNSE